MNESKPTGTSQSKKKGFHKKWWLTAVAFVLIAAAALFFGLLNYAGKKYDGDEPVRIYIPTGSDRSAVSDTLSTHLGDYGERVASLWIRFMGGDISKAVGSYVVRPGERAYRTARNISTGRQTPVRVTFNNIRLLDELAEKVSRRMNFTDNEFLSAADSILPGLGFPGKEQYPAAFVPDTYEFYWTATPSQVVESMVGIRGEFWTKERREKATKLGLTPVEVATVASIVEEETAKADERGKVARLYLNRLAKGMRLQADPTVKFALGDFALRRIGGAMLQTDSPYNTYRVTGLPPGPIRIPERATMDAVLNAPQHDFLYMCARSDFSGYHDFAVDYATHQANARAYQAQLDKRNIR